MEINDFIQARGEGLKRMGAIFWILNRIENELVTHITIFFTDWSGSHQWKSVIFNRALFNEKIFQTFESKRFFFKKIIDDLGHIAQWKNISFEEKKWLQICNDISKVQEVRNDLAHHFTTFSEDGSKASYTNLKNLTGKYVQEEIDLNDILERADCISKELMKLLPEFLEIAQLILNAADSKPQVLDKDSK